MEQDNSTMKIMIISILFGILLLIGAIFLFQKKEEPVTLPIKFEEYTDFQCPACSMYHPVINSIVAEFSDNIEYTFKHYPLFSLHPDVKIAHQGAVAAGNQGKFKEFADILFENQSAQSEQDLIGYAETLGLDMDMFRLDLVSEETIAKVDADIAEGESMNINATPTFYINGERISFASDDDPEQVLRDKISELIARAI